MFVPPRSAFVPRFRMSRLDEDLLDLLSPRERAEVVAILPFATPMLGGSPFVGFSTSYTTTGSQTVPIPAGATQAVIEGYGAGSFGYQYNSSGYGGGGANYARTTASLAGLTGLYITVPVAGTGQVGPSAIARANSSGGTILMQAGGGVYGASASVSNVGDVSYNGGRGYGATNGGGGGAAGPNGAGGAGGSSTGGAGGGGLAGSGGATGKVGNNYGGGGASNQNGAQGAIKITWS